MKNRVSAWNTFALLFCIFLFLLQSYQEVSMYLRKDIFTTTSIEEMQEGHMVLVFCRDPPVLDHTLNMTQLLDKIIRPVSSKITMKRLKTLYKGVCLAFQADFIQLVESTYLYYDWGKR